MRITGEQILHEQKWTLLKERSYTDLRGRPGRWTYIERRGGRKAVVIVPVTAESGSLIIIEQFRVPFGAGVLEFPAGLVDAGERPEQTARRELREETGYEGEVLEIGPEVSTSAGLASELILMVYMRVGEQPAAEPRPEGSERIRVLKIRPDGFAGLLEDCRRNKRILDAKLYMYLKEKTEKHHDG